MKHSPVFSIIVPAKNASHFIHEALDSVLDQTFGDYEIIVVDDSSCDATVEIVSDYQNKFEAGQLKILFCPTDHIPGPGAVRNVGIRAATGEFLAFLDADDIWEPSHLENAYCSLNKHHKAVAYYTQAQTFDAVTKERISIIGWGPENSITAVPFEASQLVIADDPVPHSTGCVRRYVAEAVGGFEERLLTAQDWWFWICAAKQGQFVFNPKVEMFYRIDSNSHTGGGYGVNPMLSGPSFVDIAKHSNILTEDEYRHIRSLVTERTSRRVQHFVRTLQWNVLKKLLRRMQSCPSSEKLIWIRVWATAAKGLGRRTLRSTAVRLNLLSPDRQFE
ncbi:MAG: glycosyltransferase family 2 protein [Desulfobacteraceae bacterium]|nr:glycosyltransferase family 2 protein [Desulfobacteraceae bacterium]